MMNSYHVFRDEIPEALQRFAKLKEVIGNDDKIFLRGELDVVDKTGHYWESYEVEIHHADGFPFKFPDVYEIGGKIPRMADWHVYEDTQTCCITVLPQEMIKCRNGIRLVGFIENEVLPYFFNQTHRRQEGCYAKGEYSHGYLGILEFFETELWTSGNVRATIEMLFKIASLSKPGRNENCFCGKKIKYRKCHRGAYEKLKILGNNQLIWFANGIARDSGNLDLVR